MVNSLALLKTPLLVNRQSIIFCNKLPGSLQPRTSRTILYIYFLRRIRECPRCDRNATHVLPVQYHTHTHTHSHKHTHTHTHKHKHMHTHTPVQLAAFGCCSSCPLDNGKIVLSIGQRVTIKKNSSPHLSPCGPGYFCSE